MLFLFALFQLSVNGFIVTIMIADAESGQIKPY